MSIIKNKTSHLHLKITACSSSTPAFRARGPQQFRWGREQKIRTEENSHVIAAKTLEKTHTTVSGEARARCAARRERPALHWRRSGGRPPRPGDGPAAAARASVRQTAERVGPPASPRLARLRRVPCSNLYKSLRLQPSRVHYDTSELAGRCDGV